MSQENNKQPKTQPNSEASFQASGKDKESLTVEELRMQLEAERQRAEVERREREAEKQRREKAEKRLKKIFKRGLRIEDLGLKGAFFSFLKVLKTRIQQLISVNFSHFPSWLWFGLKKGKILAYLTTFLLILAIFLPSVFLIGQLSKLITQQQSQKQQTSQHFSTGTLNLADTSINLSASAAPLTFTHTNTADTQADFEGSGVNIHKGFGYLGRYDKIGNGFEIDPTRPEETGLVGLWHMNNDWQDSSGKGNHGTSGGDATFSTTAKLGSHSGSFSGAGWVDASSNINSLKSSIGTIEFWFKTTTSGNFCSYSNGTGSLGFNNFGVGNTTGDFTDESLAFMYRDGAGVDVLRAFVRKGESFYLDNVWHHVAFVMGTDFNAIYVDGVKVDVFYTNGSASTGGVFSNDATFNTFTLGNRKLGGVYDYAYTGLIDEVAIYNGALTDEEIRQHYEQGSPKDTSLYRSPRFDLGVKTKLSSANLIKNVPAGTDMKAYLRSGNTLGVDTDNIDPSVLRDTSKAEFEGGLVKTNINTTIQGEMNAGTSGLVGLWHMNNDNWQDASGNNNHGTCITCPAFTADAKLGSAAGSFDGTDDYVSVPDHPSLNIYGANQVSTLELWAKLSPQTNTWSRFVCKSDGSNSRAFELFYHSTEDRYIFQSYDGTNLVIVKSSTGLDDNQWHHLAIIRSDTPKFYVDGMDVSNAADGSSFGINFNNTLPVRFGSDLTGGWPLGGLIDEVAIYSRALSPEEILDHYNAGAGKELFPPASLSTFISSNINLGASYDLDVVGLQTDIPSETSLEVQVRSASTETGLSTAAWVTVPALEIGTNKINVLSINQGDPNYQKNPFWQYKINGTTDGNRTWVVRDVFLIPQPSGYSRLKRIDNNSSEVQNVGDNRYFQYLVFGASNGSAVWELDKIDLFSRFSAFDLGKRYQIAEVSLTDSDDLFYRIHYSLENNPNYLSVTAWQDVGDKTAANTLAHTFPASGQALRWLRFNRVSSTGAPPTSPVAIAFLAKEAGVYTLKKGDGTSLTRSEAGTTRAYYEVLLPSAAIGKTSEIQTYQICAGNLGDLRNLTIKALTHPEGTDGYKCASLSWTGSLTDEDQWIDASEGPGERATITPLTLGYGDSSLILPKNTGCKNFYLRTKVPLTDVAEGPKKIRFYFEGEVL